MMHLLVRIIGLAQFFQASRAHFVVQGIDSVLAPVTDLPDVNAVLDGTGDPDGEITMPDSENPEEKWTYESVQFFCTLGMARACEALRAFKGPGGHGSASLEAIPISDPLLDKDDLEQLLDEPARWTPVEYAPEEEAPNADTSNCLPEGQLVFQHVMKTGGISIDEFLQCECENGNCGIFHDDGEHHLIFKNSCGKLGICTTHEIYMSRMDHRACGPVFANAKVFTMLRDPVARVWSFYSYMRRKYKPFQERSLESILENLGTEDLNDGLSHNERCHNCMAQLSNFMVLGTFCGYANVSNCVSLQAQVLPQRVLLEALSLSKGVIAQLHGIFFFDDIADFPEMWENARPSLLPSSSKRKNCTIHQANPTNTVDESNVFSWRTLNMIKQRNQADIALYQSAMEMPSAFTRRLEKLKEAELDYSTLVRAAEADADDS